MLSCAQLCDPMNCSSPSSSVHGILQTRIPEWVTIPFSRSSSQPSDRTWVPCTEGIFFTILATKEGQKMFTIGHFQPVPGAGKADSECQRKP